MHSILFVCTGNIHRSPLAAAFLNQLLDEHGLPGWSAESAGTWALSGERLPADVIAQANALGFDLRNHITRTVDDAILGAAALVLVMEKGQKEALITEFPARADRVYMLTEMLDGIPYDIPDPFMSPNEGAQILREMCNRIREAFPRITELARNLEGTQK